eukprot:scaffold3221_cov118-Isochrysis_galbana.AAC.9
MCRGIICTSSQTSDAEPTTALVARSAYSAGRSATQPGSRLHRSHAPRIPLSATEDSTKSSACSTGSLGQREGQARRAREHGTSNASEPAAAQTRASE